MSDSTGREPAAATVAGTRIAAPDTWGPVQRFERDNWGASMVVDSRGVTTVVWGSTRGPHHRVKAAQRTAAGVWKDPVVLGDGMDPVVAANARGDLAVVWLSEGSGWTTGVWAARRTLGHAWSSAVHVSRDKAVADSEYDCGASAPDVAWGGHRVVLATWAWGCPERGVPLRIQTAYASAGRTWGAPLTITPAVNAQHPLVAFSPSGVAWVAYERTPADGPTGIKVRRRSPLGVWGQARRIGVGRLGGISLDRDHTVSVAFASHREVQVALRPAALGHWQKPFTVTPAGVKVEWWRYVANRVGTALVAYIRPNGLVGAVRGDSHGTWTDAVTLNPGGTGFWVLTAAISPTGDMFVGWGRYGFWGRYRAAGEDWRAVTQMKSDLSVDVMEDCWSVVTPQGDPVVLYKQEERPLRARVLDVS